MDIERQSLVWRSKKKREDKICWYSAVLSGLAMTVKLEWKGQNKNVCGILWVFENSTQCIIRPTSAYECRQFTKRFRVQLHHQCRYNFDYETSLTLSRPGFFWARAAMPPFENHVPLVLTAYCWVFLKACPKLDHMTHFGFHGNHVRCVSRWLKYLISTKTSNQRHCTNCIIFGILWRYKC